MLYLKVTGLSKGFSDRMLVDDLSFRVSKGQKIAIVAKNGSGKSTLLKLIMGQVDMASGSIEFKRGLKIGYLSQSMDLDPKYTVLDVLFSSDIPGIKLIRRYEELILSNDVGSSEFSNLIDEMESFGAREYEHKIKTIISKLELGDFLGRKISTLSGGEYRRVCLAKILVDDPEFLILDEPTNHLDLQMIEWLEYYLKANDITILMVTHDRYFLERVCNEIWELDRGTFYKYDGNYSYFLEAKAKRDEIERLKLHKLDMLYRKELERVRKAPGARSTKSVYREDRFDGIKDRLKKGTSDQVIKDMKLTISMQERKLGPKILKLKNISKSFGDKVILKDFTYDFKHRERIGIVGKNGVGKSSFVSLLMGDIIYDSGLYNLGESIRFGYYSQKDVEYPEGMRLIDVVREVGEFIIDGNGERITAPMLLQRFLFPTNMHHVIANSLSGGEKKRLNLLCVLMGSPNFLILDEPTNDLDLLTLLVLEDFLLSYDGCLLIVTHDRFFMDRLVDHLFIFKGNGIVDDFYGTYSDYINSENSKPDLDTSSISLEKSKQQDLPKKLSYMEKREYDQLEKDISLLEKEKDEINSLLEVGSGDYDNIRSLSERFGEIERSLSVKLSRWFELGERL